MQVDPVVAVARDLTEIVELAGHLEDQAEHKANDPEYLPGGSAMVALGPVANLEAWEHQFEARERLGRDHDHVRDEDDQWEPPLQTLCFWSEQWRAEHGAEYGKRPTIASEAAFIRWALDWAWDNEIHWDDFARDIARCRTRMENLLYAGDRAERGVPCMYDECGGVRLVRKLAPKRDAEGEKVWDFTDWHCPRCKRSWDNDAYWRNVNAANERVQREEIEGDAWCSVEYAAREVERSPKTIRTWINRGHVATACIILGRRMRFVSLSDVKARDEEAKTRRRTDAA